MLSAVSSPSSSTLTAMQSLRSLNKQTTALQSQIATGKRVNSAKDDAAIWSLSMDLKSNIATNTETLKGLSAGEAMLKTASSAMDSIRQILKDMDSAITKAQLNGQTENQLEVILNDYIASLETVADNAEYQGTNLVKGLASVTKTIVTSVKKDGSVNSFSVAGQVVNTGAATGTWKDLKDAVTALSGTTALTRSDTNVADLVTKLTAAVTASDTAAAAFNGKLSVISVQSEFLTKMNDNMSQSLSAMVDTDMDEASARLTALQTQQQLATQLLSITAQNQASLLQTLFRSF